MTEPDRSAAPAGGIRPAAVCSALLAALDAAEGRRRSRKRNQTPDAIGLDAKRVLLERVVHDDPEPQAFEGWLLRYVSGQAADGAHSSAWAMARAVLDEWRLAHTMPQFAFWLAGGAPSDDVRPDGAKQTEPNRAAPAVFDRTDPVPEGH